MSEDLSAPLDTRRIDRGLNIARVAVIGLVLLPLLPFIYVLAFSGQISTSADQGQALFDSMRTYIQVAIGISCLLIPLTAYIGLRLIFRKRAITQQNHRGSLFLGAMVVWLVYAFLSLALFILWRVSPNS